MRKLEAIEALWSTGKFDYLIDPDRLAETICKKCLHKADDAMCKIDKQPYYQLKNHRVCCLGFKLWLAGSDGVKRTLEEHKAIMGK
jgi:hypothetical protein